MDLEEKKIKYLEFIENAVSRMNTNSMQLKTWCVALVSAFTVLDIERKFSYGYLFCIPVLVIWFLDSKYLWQERMYRKLYDKIKNELNGKEEKVDLFAMNIKSMKEENICFCNIFFSWSECIFYIVMLVFCIFTYIIGGRSNA